MKFIITICMLVFLLNVLYADVCWDNGTPVYKENFIYSEKSAVTSIGNIYITWAELDSSYRKLKLQKTNSTGVPIWDESITIDQSSDFLIETNIVSSGIDGCFISATLPDQSLEKLYKVDSNGIVLWEYLYNAGSGYSMNLLPLDNGGVLKTDTINDFPDVFVGTYINGDGTVIFEDVQFYEFNDSFDKILEQHYVNGCFYCVLKDGNNCFLIKINEDGEVIGQSNSFSITSDVSSNFVDNTFFVFYTNTETDSLEMHRFDLDGNSLLAEDPKIICGTQGLKEKEFPFSDTYFYAIVTNESEYPVFHRCNFSGEILDTYVYNSKFWDIQVYDQDIDFVNCINQSPTLQSFLLILNENGLSDPIYYLPDNSRNYNGEKYYLDDNFTFVGYDDFNDQEIYTMRTTGDSTLVYTIRDVECILIEPFITMKDSMLAALWWDWEVDSMVIQEFFENGTSQYGVSGKSLFEFAGNIKFIDNHFYLIDDQTQETNIISSYDLDGEQLWSEQFSTVAGTKYATIINRFYGGYICMVITYSSDYLSHIFEYIAFDENGLLWSEPIMLEITDVNLYDNVKMKGNNLFFTCYNVVYNCKVNQDGTYSDPIILDNDSNMLNIYGDENHFFLATRSDTTYMNDLYYFHNGTLMWDEPWIVYLGNYGHLCTFFEDDGFYLAGFKYPDSVNVDKFDYQHNIIEESSFDYITQNPYIHKFKVYKKSEKFIFILTTMLQGWERQLSYVIMDEAGNVIVPEFYEAIIDRDHLDTIEETLLANDAIYLNIVCGYKPLEGIYQKINYVQKIDLSDYVDVDEEITKPPSIKICSYPSPFSQITKINYSVPQRSNVELIVYNIKGQRVKQLVKNKQNVPKGSYSIIWDGTDDRGKRVGSGIYLYHLKVNDEEEKVIKSVFLR